LHSACQSVGILDCVSAMNWSNRHDASQPTQVTTGSVAITVLVFTIMTTDND